MDSVMLLLRVALSLAAVVGLVWWVGRRWGAGRTAGSGRSKEPQVQIVGRQSVGRHAGVAVVAVGSRRLLVGYGEQQVTMLTELAPVVEVQPPVTTAPPKPAPVAKKVVDADVPRPRPAVDAQPPLDLPLAGVKHGALHGSVLDPATWRQAVRTLQDRTVRR